MQDDLQCAFNVLVKGGVILYPTDTIWGIGCDATLETAVRRIYEIKHRSDSKNLIILVPDFDMLDRYVGPVPAVARELISLSERPLTLILDNARNLAPNVMADDGSVAVRVTGDMFCRQLIRLLGKPIVSTSANISGRPWPSCFIQIDKSIIKAVDYTVTLRQSEKTPGRPSGIIRLRADGTIKVIRE